jgi:hypothetical protein
VSWPQDGRASSSDLEIHASAADRRQGRSGTAGVAREEGTLEHAGVCAVWPDAIVTSDVPSGPQVIHMEITRGAESGQEEP